MGSCAGNSFKEEFLPSLSKLIYPRKTSIKILIKNENNQVMGQEIVKMNLKNPVEAKCQYVSINQKQIFISQTVLPGMDPRQQFPKDCQDSCYTNLFKLQNSQEVFLAILLDGHGKEGQQVVTFCIQFMSDFFKQNIEQIEKGMAELICSSFEKCDSALRQNKNLDVSNSGSTCVLVLINQDTIAIASVGDSRCILGRLSNQKQKGTQEESSNSQQRQIEPIAPLQGLQLTVDQKPEYQEEYNRIVKFGGTVRRLKDDNGNEVGPYRVWKGNSATPGLAMSRQDFQIDLSEMPQDLTLELFLNQQLFIIKFLKQISLQFQLQMVFGIFLLQRHNVELISSRFRRKIQKIKQQKIGGSSCKLRKKSQRQRFINCTNPM